ncbi:glycosyltransferase family 1 protein [Massilia arenosa]|uniref:Glycosyltransferase family 1 protein n=2 Tax=Zemynaea arenosa TaxID=2561931 RepID=A0A4Y9S5X1_9BURK|nr:glycosyltransferase family 1 protein [Massilia arenosa]
MSGREVKATEGALAERQLLFVVTEDWYFCSHRLHLAVAAVQQGMRVAVATNVAEHGAYIEAAGIELHPWRLKRSSVGLLAECTAVFDLWRIYRQVKPDVVHHVAIKPVVYGSLVSKLVRVPAVVNALGGMGAIFTGKSARRGIMRRLVLAAFRGLLGAPNQVLILQNPDDCSLMVEEAGVRQQSLRLIRGAGVDTREYDVAAEPEGVPLVVLPARMLRDKGVAEFVDAARLLKRRGMVARFVLVGGCDSCNPAALTETELSGWVREGVVEWWGRRSDMPAVFAASHIVCLPSYREGLPKALLEAAACGRAIVTTDVPGCREIVRHGVNGMLVPAQDAQALAHALQQLLLDSERRVRMGMAGRAMVVNDFSDTAVARHTLGLYQELLSGANR